MDGELEPDGTTDGTKPAKAPLAAPEIPPSIGASGLKGLTRNLGGADTYQSTFCLVAKSVSMLERHSLLFQIIGLIRQLIRLLKQSLYFLLHLILE